MSHKHSKYKDKYSDVIITKEDIEYEVDREKICPFLIRVFYNENDFSSLKQFDNFSFPSNELQIYTWDDANLRELTTLISGELKIKNIIKIKFSCLYYDSMGYLQRKELGDVYIDKNTPIELKTLHSLRFVIGDYIDINIVTTNKGYNSHY